MKKTIIPLALIAALAACEDPNAVRQFDNQTDSESESSDESDDGAFGDQDMNRDRDQGEGG